VTRSRTSARAAGSRFERVVADYLAVHVDDRIDRRVKLKDCARLDLGGWVREAEVERGNDDAHVALVIHKRRGTTDPGDQYVTCTLRDLVALTTGERP
jgi:hypothetical protein